MKCVSFKEFVNLPNCMFSKVSKILRSLVDVCVKWLHVFMQILTFTLLKLFLMRLIASCNLRC